MISITIIFYKHTICGKINYFMHPFKIIKHLIWIQS